LDNQFIGVFASSAVQRPGKALQIQRGKKLVSNAKESADIKHFPGSHRKSA